MQTLNSWRTLNFFGGQGAPRGRLIQQTLELLSNRMQCRRREQPMPGQSCAADAASPLGTAPSGRSHSAFRGRCAQRAPGRPTGGLPLSNTLKSQSSYVIEYVSRFLVYCDVFHAVGLPKTQVTPRDTTWDAPRDVPPPSTPAQEAAPAEDQFEQPARGPTPFGQH